MNVSYFEYWKEDSSRNLIEDAGGWIADHATLSVAVADGATRGSFTGELARRLVDAFLQKQFSTGKELETSLTEIIRIMHRYWTVEGRLTRFQKMGLTEPTCAAFAGAKFCFDTKKYQVITVGDSCFFHIDSDGTLLRQIPQLEQFGNTPDLAGGYLIHGIPLADTAAKTVTGCGGWSGSSLFVLATDALSDWITAADPSERIRFVEMWRSAEDSLRTAWIKESRQSGALKDDDIAAVVIKTERQM